MTDTISTHTECRNPATCEIIGKIPCTTEDELTRIFASCRAVQPAWASTPIKERARAMIKVRDYLLDNADDIAAVISQDNGKVKMEALAFEVFPAILAADYYAKNARRFLKDKRLRPGSILLAYKRSKVVHVPYGVVGIISPWNYPFGIPFHEVVLGLLSGNAVILKTASQTLLVGQKMAECFQKAGLPEDIFHFVNMPGEMAGRAFLENGVDKLFFTGSNSVGKALSSKAAETLTPLSLELGGNDPMLVCADADIHRAVMGAIWGGFTNSGQNCGAVERVYVHQDVYEPFMELLKEKLTGLKVGIWSDFDCDMGVMTTTAQISTVKRHLEDALQKGAKIFAQSGQIDGALNNALPAVVLTDVNHDMLVMSEETFGPLLPVMKVRDMEEAIALANDSDLGLTASVWSKNRGYAETLARRLEVGVVNINDHLMSHGMAETPWGGFKSSGNGSRTHGRWGFEEMTQVQVIIKDYFPFARRSIWWYPYNKRVYDAFLNLPNLLFGKTPGEMIKGIRALLALIPRYFSKR
ncbi:MAG TPA: aldehyde dehydrogenase family protein [Desulfatiglandales bacterium]|nr:aldehyde dehydrogenase family protein [Desulfatiglandales bacterium]